MKVRPANQSRRVRPAIVLSDFAEPTVLVVVVDDGLADPHAPRATAHASIITSNRMNRERAVATPAQYPWQRRPWDAPVTNKLAVALV